MVKLLFIIIGLFLIAANACIAEPMVIDGERLDARKDLKMHPAKGKPLQGAVEKKMQRVERPIQAPPVAKPLTGDVDANAFNLQSQTPSLDATTEHSAAADTSSMPLSATIESMTRGTSTLKTKPLIPNNAPLTATTAATAGGAESTGGGGDSGSTETKAPASHQLGLKKAFIVRLKRFRALNEMEVVWEAFNFANNLLKRGADVTIVLDMEAANAANPHDTMSTEFNRKGTTESKLTTSVALLRQFIDGGGQVLVPERWARYFCMRGSTVSGVKFVSDDELADAFIDSNANVIDY